MNNRRVNGVVEKREELNSESLRYVGIRWNDVRKCRRYV